MPKATHTINTPTGDPLGGAPTAVYGKKDLKARTDAAKAAGVPVTVRKLGKGER